jgi:hypothetical protein
MADRGGGFVFPVGAWEAPRGTAYGIYNAALGILDFPASLVAGLLWRWIASPAPFIFGGAMALIAALVLGRDALARTPLQTTHRQESPGTRSGLAI